MDDKVLQQVTGRIVNVYATNDKVLKYVLRVVQFKNQPIGLSELKVENVNIENYDVTGFVNGHTGYRAKMREILKHIDYNLDTKHYLQIFDEFD